ncbi:uncharacterized protein DUF4087 [Sphaerotilus hippei]|uniref:Uncharacterized protein DUF4087 n=1 Tax=Sphaerotilus hippei TaxID=744406 RepID=A0A318GUT1_9BURK|nr:DUF4087 domain-containing protein [Sphaerotilus hippei]PXW92791.1 uncharacterized protein DUF4087 [Sphaerotilus hippei]
MISTGRRRQARRVALALLGSALVVSAAVAGPVRRCGWFQNPTPGNAWLVDRDGEWVVGLQGGHQAEGDWPVFSQARWVRTNGHYGHGCACLTVRVDAAARTVLRIDAATARPLSACRRDPRLPRE